jgi:hypothetical protein
MLKYVTIKKFSEFSGYTDDAVRTKIRDNVFREGLEWHKAPDGRSLIDLEGYESWVERQSIKTSTLLVKAVSRSGSAIPRSPIGARSGYNSSPLPLT